MKEPKTRVTITKTNTGLNKAIQRGAILVGCVYEDGTAALCSRELDITRGLSALIERAASDDYRGKFPVAEYVVPGGSPVDPGLCLAIALMANAVQGSAPDIAAWVAAIVASRLLIANAEPLNALDATAHGRVVRLWYERQQIDKGDSRGPHAWMHGVKGWNGIAAKWLREATAQVAAAQAALAEAATTNAAKERELQIDVDVINETAYGTEVLLVQVESDPDLDQLRRAGCIVLVLCGATLHVLAPSGKIECLYLGVGFVSWFRHHNKAVSVVTVTPAVSPTPDKPYADMTSPTHHVVQACNLERAQGIADAMKHRADKDQYWELQRWEIEDRKPKKQP